MKQTLVHKTKRESGKRNFIPQFKSKKQTEEEEGGGGGLVESQTSKATLFVHEGVGGRERDKE